MALFGWGNKGGKDDKSKVKGPGGADVTIAAKDVKSGTPPATTTGGSAPTLSQKSAAAPSAAAAIEAELKDLHSKINTVLREKLGDSVDVRDTSDDPDFLLSNTQIRIVVSSDEAEREGKNLIPAIVKALVKTGVPKEALRLDELSMKGQWILPESAMKAAFADFETIKNDKAKLLNAIRAKHDNFEKIQVAIRKDDSVIISNIKLLDEDTNEEISRGVLFSDESTRTAFKDSIKRRYIIAIGADATKLKPMLQKPAPDKDTADDSLPLATTPDKPAAAPTTPPKEDATIPLAYNTSPPPAAANARPMGSDLIVNTGSGRQILLSAEDDDGNTPTKTPPNEEKNGSGSKTFDPVTAPALKKPTAIAPVNVSQKPVEKKTAEQILTALKSLSYGSEAEYKAGASEAEGTFTLTFYDTDGFRNLMTKVVGNKQSTQEFELPTGMVRWTVDNKANNLSGNLEKDTATVTEKLKLENITLVPNGSEQYRITGVPEGKKPEGSGLVVKSIDKQITLTLSEAEAQQRVQMGKLRA